MAQKSPRIGNESQFSLGRLTNLNAAGEGTALPPRQVGPFRIPFVTGLNVASTRNVGGQTQFTLVWNDPPPSQGDVAFYNIYIVPLIKNNQPPIGPYKCQRSPANITLPGQNTAQLTFIVQTVLTNGYVSDLSSSPTTTGVTLAPAGTFFSGSNTTGVGAANLAANCPALDPTTPYTWLQATSDDGSTVYIPCWK